MIDWSASRIDKVIVGIISADTGRIGGWVGPEIILVNSGK
jgi:hypothetical protein